MRFTHYGAVVFAALALSLPGLNLAHAEETDQFTLPPQPLVDIGPYVSREVYAALEAAVQQTNSEIDADSRSAAERSSDSYIVNLIESKFGEGLPEAKLESELSWGDYPADLQPMRARETWAWNTIYWLVFTPTPGSLTFLAPTINMYGIYFGTDKIGHFFQQGQGYYDIYTQKLSEGATPDEAHAAIVAHGQSEEHGFFGTALDGVYSNGDLSANYGGWKFYMNFAHPVQIGNEMLPPMLEFVKGHWQFARRISPDQLLKPFLTENLSEALNPSEYFYDVGLLRKHIAARCGDWIRREGITKQFVDEKLQQTRLWNGEDYGHWMPADGGITLDICFKAQN